MPLPKILRLLMRFDAKESVTNKRLVTNTSVRKFAALSKEKAELKIQTGNTCA